MGDSMEKENFEDYEDAVMHCAELLMKASTVDAEENREAARIAGRELRFGALEMRRLDSEEQRVIQSVCFLKTENEDRTRTKEFCYEEENGVTAVYTIYPLVEQDEWSGRALKCLSFFMMQLHEANERQNLVQDAKYYRYHDPQTKHTNMAYYFECCDFYIKNRIIDQYTAMSVNLCDFTNLNLMIGSSNCDTVLIRYMDWLKEGLGDDEVVSRISGDQFALLIRKEHEDMILENFVPVRFLMEIAQVMLRQFRQKQESTGCRQMWKATIM